MKETNQPLLSICIPTYNRAELLKKTLAYLAETLDPTYEITVSNNASTDNTLEVLEDFKGKWNQLRYVTQSKLLTSTQNFGAALCLATGKYSYSFCDDDRLVLDGLTAAMDLMEEKPEIVGVFGSYQECNAVNEEVLCTLEYVKETTIYSKSSSKLEIYNSTPILFSPIMRAEQCRRFCVHSYDRHSPGYWPFVSKMLDHGDVAVMPDIFYKHLQVEPRGEFSLTEGWCHDKNRTQFELFLGEIDGDSPENAMKISMRTTPAYKHGCKFAMIKKDWFTTRNYLLRARAYGLIDDNEFRLWEAKYLKEMVAERIGEIISVVPGIKKVIFESHKLTDHVGEMFTENQPDIEFQQLSKNDIINRKTMPDEFIVAWDFETLRTRARNVENDPLRQYALQDIFKSIMVMHTNLT